MKKYQHLQTFYQIYMAQEAKEYAGTLLDLYNFFLRLENHIKQGKIALKNGKLIPSVVAYSNSLMSSESVFWNYQEKFSRLVAFSNVIKMQYDDVMPGILQNLDNDTIIDVVDKYGYHERFERLVIHDVVDSLDPIISKFTNELFR